MNVAWRRAMKPRITILALLATVLLVACGTTVYFTPTNASPRPLAPRPVHTVAVFTTGAPNQPYVEVGLLQARQESELSLDEMPEIIQAMRQEAASIGCDGLIVTGRADALEESSGDVHTLEGFMGTCIMFVQTAGGAVPVQ